MFTKTFSKDHSLELEVDIKKSFRIKMEGEKEFQIYGKRERLEIKIGWIKRREMQGCEKCKLQIAEIQIAGIWIARTRITSKRRKEQDQMTPNN